MPKKPAKKPVKKSKSYTCESCKINKVTEERFSLLGKAICFECSDSQSDVMAIQNCDKDGVVEMDFIDSKTFYAYTKTKAEE